MTDQQSLTNQTQLPQFNITELGAKFGAQDAQLYGQIITFEKQLTAQALTIQAMTKNEAALVDRIQELEAESVELKKSLEIMINEPYREREVEQAAMSPQAAELMQEGREIIQATKKPPD